MKRALALMGMFYLGLCPVRAELDFETRTTSYEAKADEESFEARFTFTNTGKHPIAIQKVDTNCGCISATTDKQRYEPGAEGTVTAVFKIGSAEGIQSKSVSLIWAEELPVVKPKVVQPSPETGNLPVPAPAEAEPSTPLGPSSVERLTVELHVPVIIEIEPKITKWPVGGPSETKSVQITMNHDKPITIRDVRSSRPNIQVATKEIEPGKRYELQLTPGTTESVQLGMLTIETDCDLLRHRKKLAFFSIHRPAPGAGLPGLKPGTAESAKTTEAAAGSGEEDQPSS